MKKILSLTLAFVMIFSLSAAVLASGYSSPPDDDDYEPPSSGSGSKVPVKEKEEKEEEQKEEAEEAVSNAVGNAIKESTGNADASGNVVVNVIGSVSGDTIKEAANNATAKGSATATVTLNNVDPKSNTVLSQVTFDAKLAPSKGIDLVMSNESGTATNSAKRFANTFTNASDKTLEIGKPDAYGMTVALAIYPTQLDIDDLENTFLYLYNPETNKYSRLDYGVDKNGFIRVNVTGGGVIVASNGALEK